MLPAEQVGRTGPVACDHCGLAVPAARVEAAAEHSFCCAGCETVYGAIHRFGLQAFYRHAEAAGDARIPAEVRGDSFEEWDDPAFVERESDAVDGSVRRIELYLEGVHCGACLWLVERLPRILDGVREARLDLRRRVVHIEWDDRQVTPARIGRTLDSLGYTPHVYRGSDVDRIERDENRRHLIGIAVAAACAGNVMLLAFALYGGMLHGMAPAYEALFRWAGLGLTAVALVGPGRVFLRGAVSSIRTGRPHMDLPVAIALTLGLAWGAVNTVRGEGQVYFESLAAVIFLLLIGRYLQHRQRRDAQDAVALLYSLIPATARRRRADGSTERVALVSLAEGDHVEVLPGESFPADGRIVSGATRVDRSLLTGESRPLPADEGDEVHAGTVNLERTVDVAVADTGTGTRVGRLMALVEELARDRPPVVRLADRVAGTFVRIVLLLAAATAAAWALVDVDAGLEHAITLLIVTCPCALGLATPLAMQAAIGRAARAGILIHGGDALEALNGQGRVWLDKTGTLTFGTMTVVSWRGDAAARRPVAAIESQIPHPVARALAEGVDDTPAGGVVHEPSGGVVGRVDAATYRIGSPAFVRAAVDEVPIEIRRAHRDTVHDGHTPVWVAREGRVVAVAGLGDAVRPEAVASLEAFRRAGFRVGILSGDDEEIVRRVAAEVGIPVADAHGGLTPERKTEIVREGQANGETVVMVGDGLNDAAALSAADVGIAVSGGAEASLAAASVFLTRSGLTPIHELLAGSRRTLRGIRRNVMLSIAYNLVAGSLAVAGLINPLAAAVLMPLSSLTVVAHSYRMRTFEREKTACR